MDPSDDDGPGDTLSDLLYLTAIAAVAAVIIVLVALLFIRRTRLGRAQKPE